MVLPPGGSIEYSVKELTATAQKEGVDFDEWGLCAHQDMFWIGNNGFANNEMVLKVPLLDIIDQKEREYPDWSDREIFVFFGLDSVLGEFKWALFSKPEKEEGMQDLLFNRTDLN